MKTTKIIIVLLIIAPVFCYAGVVVEFEGSKDICRIECEIADTPEARSVGLMNRKSLPENSGMIFEFDSESQQAIWMKNTYIPLDLVFIDKSGKVVNVASGVPHSLTHIESGLPVKYIVEMNSGISEKCGIAYGTRMKLFGSR